MLQRFTLWLTPHHSSITVQNGATRQTSADTLTEAIAALTPEDRQTLITTCTAVADIAQGKDDTWARGQFAALLEKQ